MGNDSEPTLSMKAPTVSVVVPTFNRAKEVGRCLDSLVAQTFKDFEVLVCDDGSVDGTGDVVRRYSDRLNLTYKWSENFGGPARPRNIGVALARGEFIAFLDSDDWWLPQKLEKSMEYFERGADLVYHDLHVATKPGQRLFWRKSASRVLAKPIFVDLLVNGNALNNSSVVVRGNLLDAIGGFSEARDLIAAEDYDAWIRIARVTDRFVRIPEVLGCYWVGDGNISNPRRTVSTIDAIETKYARELSDLCRDHSPYWLTYVKARCYYTLGLYERAKVTLTSMETSHAPLSVRARKLWMLFVIGLRKAQSPTA